MGGIQSLLVLGGASDIGLATVRRLARDGLRRVTLAGRNVGALSQSAAGLKDLGLEVAVERWDATDVDLHDAVLGAVFGQGEIDAVLLAAGALGDDAAIRQDARATADLLTTNFTGPAAALVVCARLFREQGHGTIIVLSSVAGERARKSNFVYGSSKAGLDAFAQGLGDSLAGTGVGVLVVRPGFVKTKMTEGLEAAPLSVTADQVADAVADGLRRGRHTVWAPAPIRGVMVVLRHLPRPVFRRLPI